MAADSRQAEQEHLPISEILADRPGAGSPFGEDLTFPLPSERIVYRLPDSDDIDPADHAG